MPVTVGDLKNNRRRVMVHYDGLSIELIYRPGAITPGFADEGNDRTFLVDMLQRLVVGWDIYEDEAYTVMMPITAESLNSDTFGLPLLRAMFDAIMQDTLPGKRNGAISDAG